MKILRATLYPPTGQQPITTVMREIDLAVTFAEAAAEAGKVVPGALVVTETFTLPEQSSIAEATLAAQRRWQERIRRETDMSILYHWYGAMFERVRAGGVATGTRPAPLSVAEIEHALTQLAYHPNYDRQTVVVLAEDGRTVVKMKNGQTTREVMV